MSRLSKQRAKERFLATVEGVDKDVILDEIRGDIGEDDLYTYFVKKDAFNTGVLEEVDINEFLLKVYSDWYFLHKNVGNKNPKAVKLLSEYSYSPVNLTGNSCYELVKNGEYRDVLPMFFQYINKLDEKFFICVRTDELYNRNFAGFKYEVRLYINLPHDKLLYFAKEFVDKAYIEEFPALLKILNNDYRCDTVTIYTDYEYVEKVIDVINAIKYESKSIFEKVGKVNSLLGNVDDVIGFGEQLHTGATYFASRCQALASMQNFAGIEVLRKSIVADEQKIIFTRDGKKFTASEYLAMLIEKNAIKLIENKIDELERNGDDDSEELNRLYAIRDNVSSGIDINSEVNKLKKSITRKCDYNLEIDGVGVDDYDYMSRLYRVFTSEEDRELKTYTSIQKRNLIASHMFRTTDKFDGVHTREFLEAYFRAELALVIKNVIDEELNSIKRTTQSGVIANIKKKTCQKLSIILKHILNDTDEGRLYIGDAVNDYVRILSTDAFDSVEISIDGRKISIDKDINSDIISLLPSMQEDVNKLALDNGFIDNILDGFGINIENLCINKETKNITKKHQKKKTERREYYYNPEGYLSRETI